jgi:hypothetical protein
MTDPAITLTDTPNVESTPALVEEPNFLGHPISLAFLSMTEA